MSDETELTQSNFRDQRAGLIIFGILGVAAGLLSALLALAVVAASFIPSQPGMPLFSIVQGAGFYVGLAVAFCWLGIGSILCRRWARALILTGAWLWLAMGVSGFATLLAMHGFFDKAMADAFAETSKQTPPEFIPIFKTIMFVMFGVIYVAAPTALVAFYRRRPVKLTCEARDPVARWTDGVPLPVLAAGLLLASFACGLAVAAAAPAWPLFTKLLKAPASTAAILAQAALLGISAWGLWRLRPWAWWTGLIVNLVMFASFLVYIRTAGMAAYLTAFGLDDRQTRLVKDMPFFTGGPWEWLMALYPVCFVVFMLWVRRYLRPPA